MKKPSIIFVVPCFNEEERLQPARFLQAARSFDGVEFCFVDDGSTDGTRKILAQLENDGDGQVSCCYLDKNSGKAEAVRQGVRFAGEKKCQFIGYWDADLATPLATIGRFQQVILEHPSAKMICGSRIKRLGADIHRHWYRHYPGRIIATGISILLGLPIYDSQCGAKVIGRDLAQQIFQDPFISPWLFDVELFARFMSLDGKRQVMEQTVELPLESWQDVGKSKISLSYLPRIPMELGRIWYRYQKGLKKP